MAERGSPLDSGTLGAAYFSLVMKKMAVELEETFAEFDSEQLFLHSPSISFQGALLQAL